MIRIKRILSILFLLAWVAGEAPRLLWKQAAPIRPMDVVALGLILVWIVFKGRDSGIIFSGDARQRERRKNIPSSLQFIAVVLFISWILGLRLWPWNEALPGLFYLLRTLVYLWLIWKAKEVFGGVKRWIPAAMFGFLVLGLGQYAFLPDMRFLLRYGWDEHYYRLVGLVLDPNYFGVMAGMILWFGIQSAILDSVSSTRSARDPRSLPRRRYLGFIDKVLSGSSSMVSETPSSVRLLVLLGLVSLVLTWSRASWLAAIAGGGWWLIAGKKKILGKFASLAILAVLGMGVWWAAPKPGGEGVNLMRTASIDQRLISWGEAIEVWRQHQWVGVGFNNYQVAQVTQVTQAEYSPSSSWLLILATTGTLGTVVIGLLVISYWLRLDNFWKGITLMIGVHAVFNNTLFYPPVLGLIAMMKAVDWPPAVRSPLPKLSASRRGVATAGFGRTGGFSQ